MDNIYVLDKNYHKIGTLSNQGVKPFAPYFNDLFVQELETGADTYEFSTISNKYTQDCMEIGHHIMFTYKNRNELFTITSIEYSHNEGYKTIGVYAESVGFELLDVYMHRPEKKKSRATNDSDGDGDDNTDDEYADPDDVYIDENGNIIYDKNGGTKPSKEEVTIDGDGNIIYRPSKNNKKNDSLEFKNISYPRFLSILLKNSGWSYTCQPGLESIKHDITVKYDTNIFAILQDSMQSYRGVELEFVYEYNNGKVKKVIKAYKDGGRGSFVGKRFEYGVNVKGITKNQEVANSQDDTVLYVDNVGIAVSYDVDFALKSAEIPEIEIGDTHYVIDNDFCPPMQIKARIGKIEISFSDPTRNKIYLANNKKISGSAIDDELDADDVADMLDDYDVGYEDYVGYHTHDSLKDSSYNYYVYLDRNNFYPNTGSLYNLGTESFPWRFLYTEAVESYNSVSSPRYFGYNYQVYYDREDMEDVTKITDSSNVTKQDLLNFIMNDLNVYEYSATEINEVVNKDVDDPEAYFPKQQYFGILSEDVVTHGNPCKTSKVGRLIGKGAVQGDTNNDSDQNDDDGHNAHTYNIPALLAALIGAFQHYVNGGKPNASSSPKDEEYEYDGGVNPGGGSDPGDDTDPDNPSTGTITSTFDVAEGNKLIANTVEATLFDGYQADLNILTVGDYIQLPDGTKIYGKGDFGSPGDNDSPDSGGGSAPSNPDTGGSGDSTVFDTITVRKIIGPDRGEGQYNRVDFEDGIGVSHIFCTSEDENRVIFIGDHLALHAGMTIDEHVTLGEDGYIEFPDGSKLTSANGLSGGSGSGTDNITANKITIGTPTDNKASRCSLCVKGNALIEGTLYIEGSYTVNGTAYSDKSLKENIRYIDAPITYNNDDLEKTDLYDFIVNQVNICEYNFIDDDRDKIGFIANDYEGTKVGDKIVFRNEETDLLGYDPNNLLFATIGALQEEVRIKDEKIASLEDRLARIEALLGINNDN